MTTFVSMLRLLSRLLFALGVLCCLVSCRGQQALRAHLATVSTLIEEHPDSALHLLERIPARRFRSARLRAERGLLYTIALDKNYIDSDNDSLIGPASHYLLRHRTTDSVRHLVHYYRGRVSQNGRNYTIAAVDYLEALRLLDTLKSPYRAGLIFSRLGEMYREQYNFENALGNFRRAYAAYERAMDTVGIYYSMFDVGNTNHKLLRYCEAEALFNNVLEYALYSNNSDLASACYSNLLLLFHDVEKYDDARNILIALESMHSADHLDFEYMIMAGIALREGNVEQAEEYIKLAELGYCGDNELFATYLRYRLALKKNLKESIDSLSESFIRQNDSLLRSVLNTSVASSERAYYSERASFTEYKLNTRKRTEWVGAILVFVVSVLLVVYFRQRIKKKQNEIFRYMEFVVELQQQALLLQHSHSLYVTQTGRLKDLLSKHFSFLDGLCQAFFEQSTTMRQKERIYSEVKKRFDQLVADGETQRDLDKIVNALHDDLIIKMRDQLARFSDDDIAFVRLVCAGFSAQVISLVFHDSVHNIYARKYRIKKRIQASNAPDKELFLSAIG